MYELQLYDPNQHRAHLAKYLRIANIENPTEYFLGLEKQDSIYSVVFVLWSERENIIVGSVCCLCHKLNINGTSMEAAFIKMPYTIGRKDKIHAMSGIVLFQELKKKFDLIYLLGRNGTQSNDSTAHAIAKKLKFKGVDFDSLLIIKIPLLSKLIAKLQYDNENIKNKDTNNAELIYGADIISNVTSNENLFIFLGEMNNQGIIVEKRFYKKIGYGVIAKILYRKGINKSRKSLILSNLNNQSKYIFFDMYAKKNNRLMFIDHGFLIIKLNKIMKYSFTYFSRELDQNLEIFPLCGSLDGDGIDKFGSLDVQKMHKN